MNGIESGIGIKAGNGNSGNSHSASRVGFLGARAVATLVRCRGVAACIEGIAERIEADFRRWPDFDKSARLACHAPEGVIELMPIADRETWSFKYVNAHPGNRTDALPTVMAFGALANLRTGQPELIAEFSLATALRTAAMSALAARVLAGPQRHVMALIGNGAQSEFQAIAFQRLLGIAKLRVFDVDPAATSKLLRNLVPFGFEVVVCASAAEACHGADIVTTVTADKRHARILDCDMIRSGMHLNAVGGDCPGKTELDRTLVARSAVFVEYEPQTRIEGEIQQLPPDFAVTEFWQVLVGRRAGRRSPDQVTLFDSVGFALEDFSALRYLCEVGTEMGLIEPIDLLPALVDSRDLFGTLRECDPAASDRMPIEEACTV